MAGTKIKYEDVDKCINDLSEKIKDAGKIKKEIEALRDQDVVSKSEVYNQAVDFCNKYINVVELNIKLAKNLSKTLSRAKLIFEDLDMDMANNMDDEGEK